MATNQQRGWHSQLAQADFSSQQLRLCFCFCNLTPATMHTMCTISARPCSDCPLVCDRGVMHTWCRAHDHPWARVHQSMCVLERKCLCKQASKAYWCMRTGCCYLCSVLRVISLPTRQQIGALPHTLYQPKTHLWSTACTVCNKPLSWCAHWAEIEEDQRNK